MPKEQQRTVKIQGQPYVIHGNHGAWKWRGADWSSHMRSVGEFRTKNDAIEDARQTAGKRK